MMQPHFSLQPVLDFRHTRVEALEVELGQLLKEREKNNALLESLYSRYQELLEELIRLQSGEINFSLLNQLRLSMKGVELRIQQQKSLVRELDKLIYLKRSEVVAAKQNEEVLETLKRKENDRYQDGLKQHENRLQDDIYISQAFRRMQKAS